jgi:hypothetical protein
VHHLQAFAVVELARDTAATAIIGEYFNRVNLYPWLPSPPNVEAGEDTAGTEAVRSGTVSELARSIVLGRRGALKAGGGRRFVRSKFGWLIFVDWKFSGFQSLEKKQPLYFSRFSARIWNGSDSRFVGFWILWAAVKLQRASTGCYEKTEECCQTEQLQVATVQLGIGLGL